MKWLMVGLLVLLLACNEETAYKTCEGEVVLSRVNTNGWGGNARTTLYFENGCQVQGYGAFQIQLGWNYKATGHADGGGRLHVQRPP